MSQHSQPSDTQQRPKHGGAVWKLAGGSMERLSAFVPADVNDAPYPPAPSVLEVLREALAYIQWAPETWADGLREALAAHYQMDARDLIVDGGSSPILERLLAIVVTPGSEVVLLAPSYSEYSALARRYGADPVEALLRPEDSFHIDLEHILSRVGRRTSAVVIGNPNNPTGTCLTRSEILLLLRNLPKTVALVVDEVYVDYVPEVSVLLDAGRCERLCVVRSFSKGFALAGLRVGYAALGQAVRREWDHRGEVPWRVGLLGDVAARAALQHAEYMRMRIAETRLSCAQLRSSLAEQVGCVTYPTCTHFFLLQPPRPGPRRHWLEPLASRGVAIRSIEWEGQGEAHPFFRITTRSPIENVRILEALKDWR